MISYKVISLVSKFAFHIQLAALHRGANKGKALGYSGHTWELDVLVFRLMHLAGFANICATDPLISL